MFGVETGLSNFPRSAKAPGHHPAIGWFPEGLSMTSWSHGTKTPLLAPQTASHPAPLEIAALAKIVEARAMSCRTWRLKDTQQNRGGTKEIETKQNYNKADTKQNHKVYKSKSSKGKPQKHVTQIRQPRNTLVVESGTGAPRTVLCAVPLSGNAESATPRKHG